MIIFNVHQHGMICIYLNLISSKYIKLEKINFMKTSIIGKGLLV
jgi:hypothetical protein